MVNISIADKPTEEVFVCGGGHQGLSMAAHLALSGVTVTLWNRTPENIADVIESHQIECSGIVNGTAVIEKASSNIAEVVSNFVMVTTPSSAHKDVARALAPYVHKEMVIVLNPGRTFGAIEFARTLKDCGVKEMPHIAETQTIVYTCRRSDKNSTVIYALKHDVKIAAIKSSDIDLILSRMPKCLRNYFVPTESVIITSLSNVGMVLHCAPVLMNIGWIETPKVDFKYYYDGISPSVARFLEKVDSERLSVAHALGYDIESTQEWLKRTYGAKGDDFHSCIRTTEAYKEIDAPRTLHHRYLLEDVPCGLVPIENAAKYCGITVPNITAIIDLASAVLDNDFRANGREFNPELLE
ncbi:MAG: NAD/NADP octopine/nopaline dehydrogenase family protein [Clostridia bacterium]|nr:NAD/NADP octopine/nopaline dehydrogenase family protein [Clostridia bacterium]